MQRCRVSLYSDDDRSVRSRDSRLSTRTAASPSRSRSPRRPNDIGDAEKNAQMHQFTLLYFCNESHRLAKIRAYRSGLLDKLRAGLRNISTGHAVFYDDLLRMSEVIFREEPVEDIRASSLQYSLDATDRRLLRIINDEMHGDIEAFDKMTAHHRVSAVHLALRLETGPVGTGASPDARTLMNLLAWRSELDPEDEVRQVYSLATMKLKFCGCGVCTLCQREFDVDLLGVLENQEEIEDVRADDLPFAVPKIIVPRCGHAIHSLCWCARLVAPTLGEDILWGHCSVCKVQFEWLQMDIRILQKVFRFVFSNYLCRALEKDGFDTMSTDLTMNGDVAQAASLAATICTNFQAEATNIITAPCEWDCLWVNISEALPAFARTPLGHSFATAVLRKLCPVEPCDVQDSESEASEASANL